jgi:hypothetical protein
MLMFLCVAALVLASIASSVAAAAPDSLSLKKGDRVRVTIAGMKAVCIIEEIQPEVLSLRSSETGALQRVRIADISSLEVRAPRSPLAGAGRGAMIGGGIGFLAGFVIGIAASSYEGTSSVTPAEGIAFFGGTLLFFGAVLGALGGLAVPGGQWEKIPLDARAGTAVSPNGTIGVGITIPIGGS